jgi:hypothetical protein
MHLPRHRTPLLAALAASSLFVACDYEPSLPASPVVAPDVASPPADTSPVADASPTADATPPDGRPAHCSASLTPGPAPLRRLTKTEYNHTVRDLLGDDSRPADRFPPEEETLGFDNNASGRGVSQVHIEQYMDAAEHLVRDAMRRRRDQIIPCDINVVDETICAEQTISRFGRRAYRRPLSEREVERYMSYYQELRPDEGFDGAIVIVLEVILQSPHFLYRTEFGRPDEDGDGVVMLTPYELASRLSFFLWGSVPDDRLLAAAEVGLLDTPEGIAAEARRMLESPKAREAAQHFHLQWLHLKKLPNVFKDPGVFPEFTEELRDLLGKETKAFVDHVIFEGEGDLTTLLSANYTFLNSTLAAFYGLPAEGTAEDTWQKFVLPADQRAGVITQGSMMATLAKFNQTSPVMRGHFLREQILCQFIAPPPADINITPPDLDPNLTTRERFRQHNDDPACAGCHAKMDPIGLPFENFDPLGRWRTHEGELPIDATGELKFTRDANGPVGDGIELVHRLARSDEVRQCYATQWFRYAHGRDVAWDDACHLHDLMKAFRASGWNIKELLVALTQTEAFRFRRVVVPGSDATP